MATPRASGPTLMTDLPSIQTSPWSGSNTPAIRRSRVVLPHPEGPNTTTHSPLSTSSDRPDRTFLLPKDLEADFTARYSIAFPPRPYPHQGCAHQPSKLVRRPA